MQFVIYPVHHVDKGLVWRIETRVTTTTTRITGWFWWKKETETTETNTYPWDGYFSSVEEAIEVIQHTHKEEVVVDSKGEEIN